MVQLIFTNYHCVTGLAPRRFICFDGISSPDCKKLGVARIEPTTAKYCDDDGVLLLDGCQQGGGGAAGVGPLHVAVLYGYQQSPVTCLSAGHQLLDWPGIRGQVIMKTSQSYLQSSQYSQSCLDRHTCTATICQHFSIFSLKQLPGLHLWFSEVGQARSGRTHSWGGMVGLVRCRGESGLEGADLQLGRWCVLNSVGPGQEWNVSVLCVVQQLVGPGEESQVAGGGSDQQWVRPGVDGRTAGCLLYGMQGWASLQRIGQQLGLVVISSGSDQEWMGALLGVYCMVCRVGQACRGLVNSWG